LTDRLRTVVSLLDASDPQSSPFLIVGIALGRANVAVDAGVG
jgi:hypothetical protein